MSDFNKRNSSKEPSNFPTSNVGHYQAEETDTGELDYNKPNGKTKQENTLETPPPQHSRDALSSDDESDPFANLPAPIPVPVRTGSPNYAANEGNSTQLHGPPLYSTTSFESHQNLGRGVNESRNFSLRANSTSEGLQYGAVNTNSSQNEMGSHYRGGPSSSTGYNSGYTYDYNPYSSGKKNASNPLSTGYQGTRQTYSAVSRQASTSTAVVGIRELDSLGKFDCLPHSSKKFEMISNYVNNSCGLDETLGTVRIHDVFEIRHKNGKSNVKKPFKKGSSVSEEWLLWFKTTSKGVQKLAQRNDGCVAFYDRICRALPGNPKTMKTPCRQLMVLCAVSLGKVYESPHGFQHWSFKGNVPQRFSTVKGMGKFVPDWRENDGDDSVIVPLGKSVKNQKFSSYNLDFNEYIVFEGRRIKVKYAVDVEIIPAIEGR